MNDRMYARRLLPAGFILLVLGPAGTFASAEQGVSASPQAALRYLLASEGLARSGRWKCAPLLADVNKDGHVDLAAHPRKEFSSSVWLGDGKGGWNESSSGLEMPEGTCGGGLDFGDIDGDGNLDLAVADHCRGVFVYLGNGKGRWQPATLALNPEFALRPEHLALPDNPYIGTEDVEVGDVNGDGKADLVVTQNDFGGLSVFLGDGTGRTWKEAEKHGLPRGAEAEKEDAQAAGWANKLALTDLDGDGHLDLAATYYLGPRVWRGDGKGGWTPWSQGLPVMERGGLYRRLAVGDLNGDKKPDLAVTRMDKGVEVYLQQGKDGWKPEPVEVPEVSTSAEGIAVGDLDGDGRNEMVVGASAKTKAGYGLHVLRRDERGAWRKVPGTGLPEKGLEITWGVEIKDVNGDKRADFAVTLGGATFAPSEDQKSDLPHLQVWLATTPEAVN